MKCDDCGADISKQGWSQVPGKGELCNTCHTTWLKAKAATEDVPHDQSTIWHKQVKAT